MTLTSGGMLPLAHVEIVACARFSKRQNPDGPSNRGERHHDHEHDRPPTRLRLHRGLSCSILTTRFREWPVLKCSRVAAFECSVTTGVRMMPKQVSGWIQNLHM